MSAEKQISLEEFLDEKSDYSHLLVHLTRSDEFMPASEVLSCILNECTLRAYNPFCVWIESLNKSPNSSLRKLFNVVCFTETPIDQIRVLLEQLQGRKHQFEPYGLVFKKSYIREKGGNPVFYVTREIARPLHALFDKQETVVDVEECRLLALTTLCEAGNDWHWEREWRVVGNLQFALDDIYCGLCPEDEIVDFEYGYEPVVFIDPRWSSGRVLNKLVAKLDIPF